MALTEDLNNSEELKELFALDKVLRNLGLWFGPPIRGSNDALRKQAIDDLDLDEPFTIDGPAYDETGLQTVNVTSETKYDKENGLLDDKIVFWKHAPYDSSQGAEPAYSHVLSVRYRKDPYQVDADGIPVMVPSQIWSGDKQLFCSTHDGGGDSPTEPKFRRLIDRIQEISQRIKENLLERECVSDLAMILNDGADGDDFYKELTGGSAFLEGLKPYGGFKTTKTVAFLDVIQEEAETLQHYCELDTLKAIHGFTRNTIENSRRLRHVWEKSATHLASGMRFVSLPQYEFNEETGRHIFSLSNYPENPPKDMVAPEEIEMARMEYEQDDSGIFVLKDWNFFESDKKNFQTLSKQHKLLGFIQKSLLSMNKGKYPAYHDIIHQVGLDDSLSQFHAPPTLEEGHECLWTPFNGRDFDKKAGPGGDSLGGGNGFSTRYRKKDGTWSEASILIDVPYQPFGAKGDWEGIQPNFEATWDSTKTIYLTHDHFDHATLEYMAQQGLMKGKRVVSSKATAHIVKARMKTLGVADEDLPLFVDYEDPNSGIVQIDANHFIDVLKDDDGNIRGYMQICKKGALHTADVDMMMFTPCFNNEQWGETYFTYGDTYEFAEHGKKFAAQGQLGLLQHPDISDEAKTQLIEQTIPLYKDGEKRKVYDDTPLLKELSEKYPDRDFSKLYIAMHDPTNCTMAGHAPRPNEVKETWRELLKVCDDDLIFHVPFSTNTAEIRTMDELISEHGILRNSSEVGGNMEVRGSVENMYGADAELDLRDFKLPYDKHPQVLYSLTINAVKSFITKREHNASLKAEKRKDDKTADEILAEDRPYQMLKLIMQKVEQELDNGNHKPEIIYQCFFSESMDKWPEVLKEAGFDLKPEDKEPDYAYLKRIPLDNFKYYQKQLKLALYEDLDIEKFEEDNPNVSTKSIIDYWANSDTAFWCIKSILKNDKEKKNGFVQFDQLKRCSRNEKRMYMALMNDQNKASLHHSRTSKIGKFFRNFSDNLLLRITGPFGTAEEQFATLFRYAYGDSLLDYDEFVRNTGYFIDDETPKTIFVTQTPSTGRAAQIAQEKLMRTIVENRDDTIFCATKNGFKVYNPKEKLEKMLTHFKNLGWNVDWDSKNNQIHVHDVPFHIHGHQFREDLRDTVKNCRAKLHTIIHNPGWENYIAAREIIEQEDGNFDTSDMKDFVGVKAQYNDGTGELEHKITDYLTPSYWLSRVRRKFGQMYGGVVEIMRTVVLRDDGNSKLSGTKVRRSGRGNSYGTFDQRVAHQAKTDFTHASDMEHSARASQVGFSKADVRAPAAPRSPGVSEMLAMQLKKEEDAPETYEEPGGLN